MRDSGQPDWKCGEVAGAFELKGPYLEGPIAKLSGGWQTRVKLAALLLHEPNLLLLDEPTNFLDLRTQILLEHFLRSHRAACLVVSHDRSFLEATCTHTLALSRGKLTMFNWRSTTVRARPCLATTAREKRRFCARWWTRSNRWRGKFAGDMAARSASTPSTSTPACRSAKPFSTISTGKPRAARKTRK